MSIIVPEAAKRGKEASNALLGDIYTRRWTSTVGKGKKKKTVEHELKVNPVSIGLGAVAAGVAAAGAGMALWLMQRKVVSTDGKTLYLVVDKYDAVYEYTTKTVLVSPEIPQETIRDKLTGRVIVVQPYVPAVYDTQTTETLVKPEYAIIRSKRGVPYGTLTGVQSAENYLTKQQKAMKFEFEGSYATTEDIELYGRKGHRFFLKYTTTQGKTYGLDERDGFSVGL